MSIEVAKYNPANYTPGHLFRPPTAVTHNELTYLINQQTRALEKGYRLNDRRLLVGTELELFIFSQDVDPHIGSQMDVEDNPNYSDEHDAKLYQLLQTAQDMQTTFPREFLHSTRYGSLCLEFRTAPQNVRDHLTTMEYFGDVMRGRCEELGVLPVVYSQHIHMSLRPVNVFNRTYGDGLTPDEQIVREEFARVGPMLLLPEEWDERGNYPYQEKVEGISGGDKIALNHPEFRMLSSEYAHDHILNLLVCLRAMSIGCTAQRNANNADDDDFYDDMDYGSIYADDYMHAVRSMGRDEALIDFFGGSTLATIARIISQYPSVSAREITVDQVRT